jgi:4-hydroxyphenylpyruvate dioxygenase-like putative hemolysin
LELEKFTNFRLQNIFKSDDLKTAILTLPDSPNIIVRTRLLDKNPFRKFNLHPKSKHLPNTRLETFTFHVTDLEEYVHIQKNQDVQFLTPKIIENDNFLFIQTKPSEYMGFSYGFIEWTEKNTQNYNPNEYSELKWEQKHPTHTFQKNIFEIDHTASRVRSHERDAAIMEFMRFTNYNFDFAIYVKKLNSITSVARLSADDFSMVFTSGIKPFDTYDTSGPTERYIHNYGTRTHHMAFRTENIDDTYSELKDAGMDFLIKLVGNEQDGLKQTFTVQSPHTMLVNEYIHRYGDFDGFFTRSNVSDLTRVTDKQ